jgi:poly(3-hydroxybutyrate) depolymerase
MTMALLSIYPETFKAGVVFSGLPYRACENQIDAYSVMQNGKELSPSAWGELVRERQTYDVVNPPRLAVFHGRDDYRVTYQNAKSIVYQWTDVHETDTVPERVENPYQARTHITRKLYKDDEEREAVVELITIDRLGYAYPVNPGMLADQGGKADNYFKDTDFWGTYEAARFFEIVYR